MLKVSLEVLTRRKYVNGALQKKRAKANRSAAIGARKHLAADDGYDDCVGVGGSGDSDLGTDEDGVGVGGSGDSDVGTDDVAGSGDSEGRMDVEVEVEVEVGLTGDSEVGTEVEVEVEVEVEIWLTGDSEVGTSDSGFDVEVESRELESGEELSPRV